jgi:hypothetical protein
MKTYRVMELCNGVVVSRQLEELLTSCRIVARPLVNKETKQHYFICKGSSARVIMHTRG